MVLKEGCLKKCPGCTHRTLSKKESEARKTTWLKKRLFQWEEKFLPLSGISSEKRWGYRDKVCLSAEWSGADWQFGLMRRDELVAIHNCPVHTKTVNKAVKIFSEKLPPVSEFPVAYYVQSGAQVVIVAKTDQLPGSEWLCDKTWAELQQTGIEGVWFHLFPSAGKRVFAKNTWNLIRGKKRSKDESGLFYGPAAFQQLIPELYNMALDEATRFLAPCKTDIVMDLYSGTGSSMKRWVQSGADVIGVELGGEAVLCAGENIPEAVILRGSCEHRIPQLRDWSDDRERRDKRRLLYVNPPRTGLEEAVRRWVSEDFKPEKIACLSCSAGTLERDLTFLCKSGYRVEKILPYDFFPQTIHVETLTLLQR